MSTMQNKPSDSPAAPGAAPGIQFEARELSKAYEHGKRSIVAVDRVSFEVREREVVSIVGQSGCGKTVLGKLLLRLERPSSGGLFFEGKAIHSEPDARLYWRRVQAVFQDPFSAFNQFFTIRAQLKSAFRLFPRRLPNAEMESLIDEALLNVNIEPREVEGKYPFELSGGQMQRMLLARIFILRPSVLVADEPTSMVDACSRATILDYLLELKKKLDMTIVFITHDIGLAYYVSDSLFIMHAGRIIDQGSPDQIISNPSSEVTKQLLDDIPSIHRDWLGRGRRVPSVPAQ